MNRTILIAEENLELLEKVGTFLEDFGYLVQTAPSRKECLGKIKAFDPGLIILRLNLPDGDALTMAQDIREFYDTEAPVLVMATPKEIDFYRRKPQARPVQSWVKWPIDNMDIYNQVSEWLGKTVDPEQFSVSGESRGAPTKARPFIAPPSKKTAAPQPARKSDGAFDEQKSEIIGNLTRMPVARLLRHLGSRQETGVLTLNHPPRRVQVHVDKGIIVNVESNYIPELSLGVFLAKKGTLTPNELSGARKRWQREGGLFGETLLSLQLVKEPDLHKSLLEQRLKKVISLFDWHWRSGTFRFERESDEFAPAAGFRLRVEPAVIEGIRSCYDRDRLMMVFGKKNRMTLPVTLEKTNAADILGRMNNAELQRVIDAIRAGRTMSQAALIAGMEETRLLQYAYALYVLDIMRFQDK